MGRTLYYRRSLSFRCDKNSSLKDGATQVVNGQRLKHYISGDSYNEDVDTIQMVTPEKFIKEEIQKTAESDLE